ADWVIDLGPEGGDGGGRVVAAGTPEDVAGVKESWTGRFLRELLTRRSAARAPAGKAKRAKAGKAAKPRGRKRKAASAAE
ncbi:MAG: hypothetical protein MI723_06390, partial [Caulobacterales bacterium]|nr:hypothetical protein [Caulobacterales bacterium]